MRPLPRVGTRITTIIDGGHVIHTRVGRTSDYERKRYPGAFSTGGDGDHFYWLSAEGVTWLSGHYALDSSAVRGLLTAHALTRVA